MNELAELDTRRGHNGTVGRAAETEESEVSEDPVSLDVLIPVLNEERVLKSTVNALATYLSTRMSDYDWRIVVIDNGSTDRTLALCRSLADTCARVDFIHLGARGRGRALKVAMAQSKADIVAYMDADLSTKLSQLPPLVAGVSSGTYDIGVGSRLCKGARVTGRSLKRELISRAYSLLVQSMFRTSFTDPQCGFKALNRRTARTVAQCARDNGWFFDSEMLILAEANGYDIGELPVQWVDDPDSRVRILSTAWGDLKGLLRLRFGGLREASLRLQRLEQRP